MFNINYNATIMHHRSLLAIFLKTFATKYHSFKCWNNFVVVVLLHLEDKRVLYIPSYRFLDHLKWTKNEKDMGFENKKG
jgi:hypothetical protein